MHTQSSKPRCQAGCISNEVQSSPGPMSSFTLGPHLDPGCNQTGQAARILGCILFDSIVLSIGSLTITPNARAVAFYHGITASRRLQRFEVLELKDNG